MLGSSACRGNSFAEVLRAISAEGDNQPVIASLRAAGPGALDELFQLREQLKSAAIQRNEADVQNRLTQKIARLDDLIDQVGMQRYCSRSRLYWYTDFQQAK